MCGWGRVSNNDPNDWNQIFLCFLCKERKRGKKKFKYLKLSEYCTKCFSMRIFDCERARRAMLPSTSSGAPPTAPTLHRSSWSPGATWLFLHAPSWLNLGNYPDLRRRIKDCFPGSLEIEAHLGIQWEETPVREKEAGSRMAGWTFRLGIPSGGRRQAGRLGRSVLDCPTLWGKFGVLSWSSEDKVDH